MEKKDAEKVKKPKKAKKAKKKSTRKPAKKPVGRPTDYNRELAEEICNAISETEKGLFDLCNMHPHWPKPQTIRRWKRDIDEFYSMYTRAKQDQIELLVEQCIDIADETSRDTLTKEDRDGNEYEVCNHEWINRSRLRVDTRKWLAAKLAPRIYGDKLLTESGNKNIEEMTESELIAEANDLLNTARERASKEATDGPKEETK